MTTVTITSAVKLTSKQLDTIKKAISKKHKSASFNQVVDQSVVGGVRIQVGSTLLDGTVKHKLNQLKLQLLNI
jgi:F-type H+-transporting ATPase subunit delta